MDADRLTACTFPLREQPLDYTFEVIRAAGFDQVDLLDAAKRLGARAVRVTPGNGKREEIDTLVPPFQESARLAEEAGQPANDGADAAFLCRGSRIQSRASGAPV